MSKAISRGCCVGLAVASAARAHDTWVQTNTNIVRVGDAAHVDLLLGNHGNDHRDFKLAGKPDLEASTLEVVLPSGKRLDVKPGLTDQGYAPSEGFWSTRFVPAEPGLYTVSHTYDKVVSYAPVRSIKSAKTCFVASRSLDNVPRDFGRLRPAAGPSAGTGSDDASGHPDGPGRAAGGPPVVSRQAVGRRPGFVHSARDDAGRGIRPEVRADDRRARARRGSRPTTATTIWSWPITKSPTRAGSNYERTKYSATLVVLVPQHCPCCE